MTYSHHTVLLRARRRVEVPPHPCDTPTGTAVPLRGRPVVNVPPASIVSQPRPEDPARTLEDSEQLRDLSRPHIVTSILSRLQWAETLERARDIDIEPFRVMYRHSASGQRLGRRLYLTPHPALFAAAGPWLRLWRFFACTPHIACTDTLCPPDGVQPSGKAEILQ